MAIIGGCKDCGFWHMGECPDKREGASETVVRQAQDWRSYQKRKNANKWWDGEKWVDLGYPPERPY